MIERLEQENKKNKDAAIGAGLNDEVK